MKTGIVWLLILLTIHAPVPCPDLDGECRGTPIESLAEMQAWHVLLLGVRPNDDIDRGPIRLNDEGLPMSADETPFGKLVVMNGSASGTATGALLVSVLPMGGEHLPRLGVDSRWCGVAPEWWRPPRALSSSRRLARLCVWRV